MDIDGCHFLSCTAPVLPPTLMDVRRTGIDGVTARVLFTVSCRLVSLFIYFVFFILFIYLHFTCFYLLVCCLLVFIYLFVYSFSFTCLFNRISSHKISL